MRASTFTLKLLPVPPTRAGARTSVASLLSAACGAAARRDATEPRLRARRDRGAVFSDRHLAWVEGSPSGTGALRDSLTTAPMRPTMHVDILVPLADNEGRPFPNSAFDTLEHFLTILCGGYTRRGDVEGAWRSPDTGDVLRDRSRSYVVTLPAEEADEQIARIESFIRRFFRQEAAFLELIPTRATVF
ncbi:MAG TPA: hypothetical protein VEO54_15220 [Thermoanaerobaculia bacterium]|nr:hypothetical protein [Thermoanaerobaculia bacterium]